MIVVRVCGGLGNQLFQYAAGRRMAECHGTELVFDLGWYERTPASNTPREFELWHYQIDARAAMGAEPTWCRLHSGRFLRRVPLLPRRWRSFRERGYDFDPTVLNLPDDTYLYGYWQSHQYFEDIADIIRNEITPLKPPSPLDAAVGDTIVATESISLHVRRGDYVTQNVAAAVHGTCSLDYYRSALAKMASLVGSPHFFVFSDDMEWVREQLNPPGAVTFVDHNGPDAAIQDLRLMSLCKHHVIANSSFSWWGAWLNPSPGKIVIAPKVWFADGRPTPTLIPNSWMRL